MRTRSCELRPLLLPDSVPFSSISTRRYASTETPRSRARASILEATSGSTLSIAHNAFSAHVFKVCRPPRSRGGLLGRINISNGALKPENIWLHIGHSENSCNQSFALNL